jgi:hypothetical protein
MFQQLKKSLTRSLVISLLDEIERLDLLGAPEQKIGVRDYDHEKPTRY